MKKIKFTGRPSDYFIQDGSEVKLNNEKLLSLISHKTDDLSVRNIVNTFFSDCDNAVKSNIIGFILYEIQYIREARLNNPDILKKEASKIANRRLIILGVIATIIVITLFSWFLTRKPSLKNKAQSKAEMNEIKLQRIAREYLSPHLKDPNSAEFKNQKGLCGEVNSNNSFGGKTGYQRFIVANKDLYILERDSGFSSTDFQAMWDKMCE